MVWSNLFVYSIITDIQQHKSIARTYIHYLRTDKSGEYWWQWPEQKTFEIGYTNNAYIHTHHSIQEGDSTYGQTRYPRQSGYPTTIKEKCRRVDRVLLNMTWDHRDRCPYLVDYGEDLMLLDATDVFVVFEIGCWLSRMNRWKDARIGDTLVRTRSDRWRIGVGAHFRFVIG